VAVCGNNVFWGGAPQTQRLTAALWVSRNEGETFLLLNGAFPGANSVAGLAFADDCLIGLALVQFRDNETHIFRSTDGGATWKDVLTYPVGGNNGPFKCTFARGPAKLATCIIGRELFNSVDAGQSWATPSKPPVSAAYSDLAYAGGRVLAAGYWGTIARSDPARSNDWEMRTR